MVRDFSKSTCLRQLLSGHGECMQVRKFSLLALLITAGLSGCGGEDAPKTAAQKEKMELFNVARMHGCMECHRVNTAVVGPSWEAISERYQAGEYTATRDLLVQSVLKGSQGKWPTWKAKDGMPALERRVDKEVVVKLVEYILNLKRPDRAGIAAPKS